MKIKTISKVDTHQNKINFQILNHFLFANVWINNELSLRHFSDQRLVILWLLERHRLHSVLNGSERLLVELLVRPNVQQVEVELVHQLDLLHLFFHAVLQSELHLQLDWLLHAHAVLAEEGGMLLLGLTVATSLVLPLMLLQKLLPSLVLDGHLLIDHLVIRQHLMQLIEQTIVLSLVHRQSLLVPLLQHFHVEAGAHEEQKLDQCHDTSDESVRVQFHVCHRDCLVANGGEGGAGGFNTFETGGCGVVTPHRHIGRIFHFKEWYYTFLILTFFKKMIGH